MPMPTHTHGFWVGMGVMLLFMGGHGWASVLYIPESNSKIGVKLLGWMYANQEALRAEANNSVTTFYLSDPTKTWYMRVIHITQFLNTWVQFE